MTARKRQTDDPFFDQAWALYPRRPNNSKLAARRAWDARIVEGIAPETMIAGLKAYIEYCNKHHTEPSFIKLASTFFGPNHHFSSDFTGNTPSVPRTISADERQLLQFYEQEVLV